MKQPSKTDKEIGVIGYLISLGVFGGFLFFFNQTNISAGRPKRWVQTIFYLMSKNDFTYWIAKSFLIILCIYFIYKIAQLLADKKTK